MRPFSAYRPGSVHVPPYSIDTLAYARRFATSNRRSLFGAVVLRFPHALQPAVYMAMHVGLCAATLVLTSVWWRYQLACEAFLVVQFTASAWSGEGRAETAGFIKFWRQRYVLPGL